MQKSHLFLLIALLIGLASCRDDEESIDINLFSDFSGTLFTVLESVANRTVLGNYLPFVTMNGMSNSWFFASDGNGTALFNGNPITGNLTGQIVLWDGGRRKKALPHGLLPIRLMPIDKTTTTSR